MKKLLEVSEQQVQAEVDYVLPDCRVIKEVIISSQWFETGHRLNVLGLQSLKYEGIAAVYI